MWLDKINDREDWSELTERTLPEFEEMTTQIQPKKIAKLPGFTLKKHRIPTEAVQQGIEWLRQHPKYCQRVGGRSWAPLKAKIRHRGTLLLTDKQKKKKKQKESKQRKKEKPEAKTEAKMLGKRKKIEWKEPTRRSKRQKKTRSILKITTTKEKQYICLLKITEDAKTLNIHRLYKYQADL